MIPDSVRTYVRKTRYIQGWFQPCAAYLFAMLDEVQKENNIRGNLFEIGVHRGKSTIVLGGMTDQGCEVLGVCDVFDDQKNNITQSGYGNLESFMHNFFSFFPEQEFLWVYSKPSSELTASETTTNCRFFHIDGGHSAEETFGDLHVASQALSQNGLVVMDDLFNCAWPGVAEGFFRFITAYPGVFVPIVIGFNKVILCRPAYYQLYANCFRDLNACWQYIPREPYHLKTIQFLGVETNVWYIPSYKSPTSLRTILYSMYFHHPWLKKSIDSIASILKQQAWTR